VDHRLKLHKLLFAAYDDYLDHHTEVRWLADPRIAAMVRSSLHHLHPDRYCLHAFTIMPNHVHVLFTPAPAELAPESSPAAATSPIDMPDIGEQPDSASPLSKIMHSLKSYTAHRANKILDRSGSFWQHESYDHWVRDDDELQRIVNYIGANPVRAALAQQPHDFYWCSAHDRLLKDGETTPWLAE
jgi:putative DNA methylase